MRGGPSVKKLIHTRKQRNHKCTLCSNHGVRSNLKGHKRLCPFLNCGCELCVRGRQRRMIMRLQVSLRRKQMKDIGNRSTYCVAEQSRVNLSPAFVKTESPFTEEHRRFDEREKATKHGGINGGLIQNVSNNFNSQLGVSRQHMFNYSAYVPTPYQLQWTIGDVFSGFHHHNWRPEETKPPTSHNFTVPDNSSYVKYCNLSQRMEGDSLRCGGSSSMEAAAVLASFAGNQKHIRSKL